MVEKLTWNAAHKADGKTGDRRRAANTANHTSGRIKKQPDAAFCPSPCAAPCSQLPQRLSSTKLPTASANHKVMLLSNPATSEHDVGRIDSNARTVL